MECLAVAAPFGAEARQKYRFQVDPEGEVQVWDSTAGHYTRCHSLETKDLERIKRIAIGKMLDLKGVMIKAGEFMWRHAGPGHCPLEVALEIERASEENDYQEYYAASNGRIYRWG